MDDKIKILEKRIAELEKQLQTVSGGQQVKIEPKELEVFKKVSKQLGYDWIEECGPNECQPVPIWKSRFVPRYFPRPIRCIFECGPIECNVWNYRDLGRGLERFNEMGF